MKINCWALFKLFSQMALLGFGGVLPFAYRYLVERSRWLSDSEFAQLLSIAQLLPGPTICNLAVIVGQRFAGTGGALAALSGLLVAPFFIVIALGVAYQELATSALFAHALQGMAAAAAGLILATAAKLARGMWRDDAPRSSATAGERPVTLPPSATRTLTAAGNDRRHSASATEREPAPAGVAMAEGVGSAVGAGQAPAGVVRDDALAGAGRAELGVAGAVGGGAAAAMGEEREARIARRVTQVALLAMAFVGLGVLKLGLVTVVCALAPFGFVMFAFVWRLP
ncbi:chromate transporter [Pseudoduganella sp. UC29_106]|uniref:chromate transporter n=1 Tax=Pseudoduganella sp. UC29_106 TaxID=3374553 RepID=UPI003757C958